MISKQKRNLGFNTLRKHIKIEPLIWYHLCDEIGMIVWQDLVNNSKYSYIIDTALPYLGKKTFNENFTRVNTRAKEIFIGAMKQTVSLLYNTPSIAYWTIFNEGWGQFNSHENFQLMKSLDNTRIVDTNSGWYDQGESDVLSIHVYFKEVVIQKNSKPIVLSEFGGYSYKISDHSFNLDKNYGYTSYNNHDDYENALFNLYEKQIIPNINYGLSAAIYTQLSDVEDETNGLLTYDRKVLKVNPKKIQSMNQKLKI